MAQSEVSQINGIFGLIEAFLALGLIIGITGLGIITIRSIHERRIEIGMMRALGYTRRMVVVNFALESAFVSVLGIIIGSLLGIAIGYQIWQNDFQVMDMDFVIAWGPIVVVGIQRSWRPFSALSRQPGERAECHLRRCFGSSEDGRC